MQRITLTVETKLAEKVKEAAKADDRSVSSVIRLALAAYFAKKGVAK